MTTFRENEAHAPGKLSLAEILEIFTAGGGAAAEIHRVRRKLGRPG